MFRQLQEFHHVNKSGQRILLAVCRVGMLRTGSDGRTVPGAASSRTPCKESISVKYAGDARTVAAAPAIQIQNTLFPADSVYHVILEYEDHTHQNQGERRLH